ncbi:MAG: hypothetical protein M4579_004365 [Chaenotheca gracillima]|nr:MAG: hypothetical protein M4579_004365 [Chaenotheca gracillima]
MSEAPAEPAAAAAGEAAAPEAIAKAPTVHPTELGWAAKTEFDYKMYNASTNEERDAMQAVGNVPEWASNAVKYEWQDDYGDVGPRVEALENQLFRDADVVESGAEFQKIKEIEVTQEGPTQIKPCMKFEDAGLHPTMLENVKLCNYDVTTPVQAYCIPAILQGFDVMASAQTGSGKTAAFLIPTLSKLMGKAKKLCAPRPNPNTFDPMVDGVRAEPLVLIVAPTRELATQIFDEARRFCYRSMLRPCVLYGGVPLKEQRAELARGCDVLIGTPGRLCDFMDKPHILSLARVKYTIIDEADEMLNSDWEEEVKKLMSGGDTNEDADHVYMMFSATFPKNARRLAKDYMANDHFRVRVGRPGSTTANVAQKVVFVEENLKKTAVYDLIMSMKPSRTIVFVNSKRTADFVDDHLYNLDLPTTSIHADRTQREREDALLAFRRGRTPILIATGVSARGLDIGKVMHVINYDLPSAAYGGIDEYIHRIGRTARIGNVGHATSFYNDKNEDVADSLVKVLLETKQDVPEFLEQYLPEGAREGIAKLNFDDDSEDSLDNDPAADANDGWDKAKAADDGWDTSPAAPAEAPAAEPAKDVAWNAAAEAAPTGEAW